MALLNICDNQKAIVKKMHIVFWFRGAIVFYSKSLITYALLLCFVSRNGLTNWGFKFEFERSRFSIEVEMIIEVAKFIGAKTSWTSSKAPPQMQSFS
jgi:hypothetical protein